MPKYYAKLVCEDQTEQLLLLEAENLRQARLEAIEYLSGFWEKEARIELYERTPKGHIPELLWCKLS